MKRGRRAQSTAREGLELPRTFRSARTFGTWLRRVGSAIPPRLYARVDPWLTLHDAPTIPDYIRPGIELRLWPLDRTLPPPDDVVAWWERLMEETIVDIYLLDHELVCAALVAVWEALPQLHLRRDKAAFRRLTSDEAEALLGANVVRPMVAETVDLGISLRRYPWPPATVPPPAGKRRPR